MKRKTLSKMYGQCWAEEIPFRLFKHRKMSATLKFDPLDLRNLQEKRKYRKLLYFVVRG